MNPLYKLGIEALVVLGLVGGGAFLAHKHYAAKIAALTVEKDAAVQARDGLLKAREVDQATLASLGQKKAAIARSGASARASLAHVSASAVPYLDTPVPQEVLDAIK